MKLNWSVLNLLLTVGLAGCGSEQFGSTPQSQSNPIKNQEVLETSSCSTYTLVKPKVDILYVVDNSFSTVYMGPEIKNSIKKTVDSISQQFDYRVIGTKLLSNNHQDYQVLTNSTDLTGLPPAPKRITNSNQFDFFNSPAEGTESGLNRVYSFMNAHKDGLFRKGAYHLVILISNGADQTVEESYPYPSTTQPKIFCADNPKPQYSCTGQTVFDQRKASLLNLKSALQSQQFRLFAVTAATGCKKEGFKPSEESYRKMAQHLYAESGASDSATEDRFDLCGSGTLSSIFASVNSSIQQVEVPHVYRYWPITFANDNDSASLNPADMQVIKYNNNGTQQVLSHNTHWTTYVHSGSSNLNTRELPTPGEPAPGKHFVRFKDNSLITYPDCVLIKSHTKKEYFGLIALNKRPIVSSIIVKINGIDVPKSDTDGWSYSDASQPMTTDTKVYPNGNADQQPVIKSGFMIKLNGRHYESGDKVDVYYLPASI